MRSCFQTLFIVDDIGVNGPESINTNTLVRRARFKFNGDAIERTSFKMEFGISNRDLLPEIPPSGNRAKMVLDAVMKFKAINSLWIWFGQTKLPGNRERVITSQKLQLVNHSPLNRVFTFVSTIGIQFRNEHVLGENFIMREMLAISRGKEETSQPEISAAMIRRFGWNSCPSANSARKAIGFYLT